MTIAFALDLIPRRMEKYGYGNEYTPIFKHLVLQPDQTLLLDAENQYLFLVDEPADVRISSETGIYDLSDNEVNELSYEHQGAIEITNQTNSVTHLRFIQVIPNN